VLETPVVIGAPDTPTPAGAFYVTDLLDNADDAGPYGPYALGLSAHSDTLSEFAGGDGRIGIHGTDTPDSIGQAVSHGCVRVPNEVVAQLARSLPLGTPVSIG
jgi:lipoprotein-anchoring transpeptidase ErfK/SrfK